MSVASGPNLAAERCVPCRGGVAPLSQDEAERLRAAIPRWRLDEQSKHLDREIRTRTFAEAFALVARIASVAEEQRHHPDIAFGWGYVRLSLQTHAIGGLHRNDFILAARIDDVIPADPSGRTD
jgi:4a-hydroxytetrahydrobiopterin dehydratase